MARHASSRKTTKMHFQSVAMSLTNYSEVFGHLPYPVRRKSVGQSTETGVA